MGNPASFTDPLEGTAPKGQNNIYDDALSNATSEYERGTIQENKKKIAKFVEAFRYHYFISCWHMNEYENFAMWTCYTPTSEAVAIRTNYGLLASLLEDQILLGLVRYLDYSKDRFSSEHLNLLDYIMHKDCYYGYEREVRALAMPLLPKHPSTPPDQNLFQEDKSPNRFVYSPKIDIRNLITEVVVHPDASDDFFAKACDFCEEKKVISPIRSRRYILTNSPRSL